MYAFAFIISLFEVVKDIEDMEGDARYQCRTMPSLGVNVSKVFSAVWLAVLLAAILILQFYVLQFKWWWSILYSIVLIITIGLDHPEIIPGNKQAGFSSIEQRY